MEFVQKYWYIVLAVVAAVFLLSKNQSSGARLQQIGGASADTVALAQIAASEREADENRRYGLASSLMQFDLSNRSLASQDALSRISLGQQIDLARISAEAQSEALRSQLSLSQLQFQSQANAQQQQYNLQSQAYNQAFNTQRRNDWLGAITSGIQTIFPQGFGNTSSGGGFRLPRISGGIFGGNLGGGIFS